MSTSIIGIKLGDGSFYPILEEDFRGQKRFVLSTVRDGQESMQIDFYRGQEEDIETSEYIGSLVIDNITPARKGEPEIEVVVGLDQDDKLHAVAKNLASSEKQSLSVSLETLPEEPAYTIPDFELDERLQPKDLFKEDEIAGESYDIDSGDRRKAPDKKRINPLFAALFVLAGLAVITGLAFLIWWLAGTFLPGQNEPNALSSSTHTEKQAGPSGKKDGKTEAAVKKTPKASASTPEPLQPKKRDDASTARPGVRYTVRRGDTLWDLSATYYRDPFQWYRIYRHKPNKIKNPDLIFVGQKIFIPEK